MNDCVSHSLLSERLRPQNFSDCATAADVIDPLELMRANKQPMNMMFNGPPGTGKTSAGLIMLNAWTDKSDVLEINRPDEMGIDQVRDIIQGFAYSPMRQALGEEGLRLCFIDEADRLSRSAQAALRVIIERSERSCRFIFAVNDLRKIDPALRSRLLSVQFGLHTDNTVKMRYRDRLVERLSEMGLQVDAQQLNQIVLDYYPDLRSINNVIEFKFGQQRR